jgi:hypothetical protein
MQLCDLTLDVTPERFTDRSERGVCRRVRVPGQTRGGKQHRGEQSVLF